MLPHAMQFAPLTGKLMTSTCSLAVWRRSRTVVLSSARHSAALSADSSTTFAVAIAIGTRTTSLRQGSLRVSPLNPHILGTVMLIHSLS